MATISTGPRLRLGERFKERVLAPRTFGKTTKELTATGLPFEDNSGQWLGRHLVITGSWR